MGPMPLLLAAVCSEVVAQAFSIYIAHQLHYQDHAQVCSVVSRNSNVMLANVSNHPTSAGCNVSSCSYGGFVNGTITTSINTGLQPRCPGNYCCCNPLSA